MSEHRHVCPWWMGYLLLSPIRNLRQNPKNILTPYLKEGMTALDIGCAMGFFSLQMAKLVGNNGKVVCIDLQEKMIKALKTRAEKAGLSERIEVRLCAEDTLGLEDISNQIDFALAFAMVHEVPDKERLLSEIQYALKEGSHLLLVEPKGHVTQEAFKKTVSIAESQNFETVHFPQINASHSVLLCKKS